MAEGYQSPGIGYTEQERTVQSSTVLDPVVAIIGGAVKGPTEVTRLGNRRQLRNKFGAAVVNDNGVFGADYILDGDCMVLYRRVCGNTASKGTAGSNADRFTFKSRFMDSTLNGYKINIKFSQDKKKVDYKLITAAGAVVENYVGLSNEVDNKRFLPVFLDTINSDIEAVLNEGTEEGEPSYGDVEVTLSGIDDGIESLTAADYIAAAEDFANPETVDFSMIIVPGVSDISVQEAYQALVARRGNAEYLPDVPFGLSPVEAKAFFDANPDRTTPKLDNMFVSAFAPWWKVIDPSSYQARWAPPSVVVARVTVDSDTRSGGCWFAAAGFAKVGSDIPGRGSVPNAVEGEYQLTQAQRDSWQEENGVLNPIITRRGRGTVVFGNRTCKRTEAYSDPSVFCDRNIRRMCNYIRRMLIDLSLGFVFDPNDSQTWKDWKATIRPFLRQIKDGRGISDFRVIMDETTVTDEDIRNRQAPGVVMIRPIRSIEWIPITFIATENGLLFNDEEEEE